MPISLVPLALSFIAGILLGKLFLFFPWSAVTVSAGSLLVCIIVSRTGRFSLLKVLFSASVALLAAALLLLSAALLPADHYSRSLTADGTQHVAEGTIASSLERADDRIAFCLALRALDGTATSGTFRVSVREEQPAFGRGDKVQLTGRIFPPRSYRNPGGFDYQAFLERQGIHAIMSVRKGSDVRVVQSGRGPLRIIEDLRERIRQAFLRGTTGESSAVLRAIVLGDPSGLTDDLRERFMTAGVTHILSISGSHLGLVTLLSFWLLRNSFFLLPERIYHRMTLTVDPKKAAAIVTVIPVTFYALLAGAEDATLRSLIMILSGLAALVLDREHDLTSSLALAALVSLVPAPQAMFDISFQLSYLSVAAILFVVSTGNIADRSRDGRLARMVRSGSVFLAISAATAIVTGPLVVLYFNQISLISIIANMIVVPFAGAILVPLGLATGLLSLLVGDLPIAHAVQHVADAFISLVTFFARVPGAMVHLPAPGILFLAAFAVLLGSTARMLRHRMLRTYRPLDAPGRLPRFLQAAGAGSLVLLVAILVLPLFRSPRTRVTFLDVGQGDCALIESQGGCTVLIDGGGTRDKRFDPGLRVAAPLLWNRGIGTIDLAVLSHPHPDHMNGLVSLIKTFAIRQVWSSGLDTELEGYDEFEEALRAKGVPLRAVHAGEDIRIKDLEIEVLHPSRSFRQLSGRAYAAENDRSLVLRMHAGKTTYLFAGDIHGEAEHALLKSGIDATADIIKVPHHGSKTSSSGALIRAVRPTAAVISVGQGNPYHHPAEATVERYREACVPVYRTDRDGAVIIRETDRGRTFITGRDLMLQRIGEGATASWAAIERNNWERLWIREWGI